MRARAALREHDTFSLRGNLIGLQYHATSISSSGYERKEKCVFPLMASSDSRRSSVSNATVVGHQTRVNPRYACHWLPICLGEHEADRCGVRKGGLRGKLGFYYSPDGAIKAFKRDELSIVSLEFNQAGCTRVCVLIYAKREAEVSILLMGAPKREKT
jgi:hypothetical protein